MGLREIPEVWIGLRQSPLQGTSRSKGVRKEQFYVVVQEKDLRAQENGRFEEHQ